MSDTAAPVAAGAPAPAQAEPQLNNEEIVDDGADLQDEGQEASAPAEGGKEAPKDVKKAADKLDAEKVPGTKKYKLVIDGQEEEVSETELISMAQKSKAADKKFSESAQIRKEAAQLVKMLQEDPESVLSDPAILGSNEKVLEFAEKLIARKIEDAQKSPEIQRAEKAERELEQFRKQQKEEQDKRQSEERESFLKQQEAQLTEQITEAITASGMPKSPFILKRMSDVMISAIENDKEITPKQAMNIVKREMSKDLKEYFDLSPDEVLEELLGDNNIKRLRKRQLAKVRAAQANPPASPASAKSPATAPKIEEKSKKINVRDWLRGQE